MNDFLKKLGDNVKNSLATTMTGIALAIFGAFLMYQTGVKELSWASIEVGLLMVGVYLVVTTDPTDYNEDNEEPKDEA